MFKQKKLYIAIETVKNEGLLAFVKKSISKVKNIAFKTNKSNWYIRPLSEYVIELSVDDEFEHFFLREKKDEIFQWIIDNKEAFPWIYCEKEIKSATENNHLYFVLKYRDSIIGYVKVGFDLVYIHDFDKNIMFSEKTAFIYDTFVHPDYRGKKLALHSLCKLIQHLNLLGFRYLVCHIEKWNKPSIKVFENAGFQQIDQIRYVKIFNIPFYLDKSHRLFLCLEKHLRPLLAINKDV